MKGRTLLPPLSLSLAHRKMGEMPRGDKNPLLPPPPSPPSPLKLNYDYARDGETDRQ